MENISNYNPEGSDLRRAQLKMLEILIEVSKICDKNGIPYWLSFGTLLGAVRHNGFIPWDDDLDIEVEYKHYILLLRCLESELPTSMILQSEKHDDKYYNKFVKVRDRNSLFLEDDSEDFKERGIFIDIFPREYSLKFLNRLMNKILELSLIDLKSKRRNFFQLSIVKLRVLLYDCLVQINRCLFNVLPMKMMFVPHFGAGIDKKYIYPLKEICFEGYKFKCPANVDAYLKEYYGDYMKLPLSEDRIVHSTKIEFYND